MVHTHTHNVHIHIIVHSSQCSGSLQLLTRVTSCHGNSIQGVFDVDAEKGLTLIELADGVSLEDVTAATGCQFEVCVCVYVQG